MAERLQINSQNAAHIQAYIDYYNTVGNADGGKLFTEKQYEEYKANLKKNAKNRIYTSWRNSAGLDCKMIGPATKCFCDHRYKEHNYLNPIDKKVACKVKGCPCSVYYYIPVYGSQDFKCLCKHSYREHDPVTKKCTRGKCNCNGKFSSTWSCSCGLKFGEHITIFETREERIALGKPVDDFDRLMGDFDVPNNGMGHFSSLVDGSESHGYQAQLMALEGGPQQYQKNMLKNDPMKAISNEESKGDTLGLGGSNNQKSLALKKPGIGGMNQREMVDLDMGEISALDLYNSPHQLGNHKMGMNVGGGGVGRRQLRY